MKFKKHTGYIIRGLQGIYHNKFVKVPEIPSDIEKFSIGSTHEGRDIDCYRIGSGKKHLAFGGGIHGNEVGTVKFIKKLISFIYESHENYPEFTFYFIPVMNPDGYEIGLKNPKYFSGGNVGRFNANGVDLNKNFPVKSFKSKSVWSRGDNFTESKEIFAGDFGGSENETKAIMAFLKDKKIDIFFCYHSRGRDVQANSVRPSKEINQIYAEKSGFRNWSEEEWSKLNHTGTPKEWCEDNNIAFSEIENSERWGSDWHNHERAIESVLEYLQNS